MFSVRKEMKFFFLDVAVLDCVFGRQDKMVKVMNLCSRRQIPSGVPHLSVPLNL